MDIEFEINEYVILCCFLKKGNTETLNRIWDEFPQFRKEYRTLRKTRISTNTDHSGEEFVRIMYEYPEFKKIISETKIYADILEREWLDIREIIMKLLKNILRIDIQNKFKLYVVHPQLSSGWSLHRFEKNAFIYGHHDLWNNYNVVYLVHEALHSILPFGFIPHAIQQLACDNELRVQLNKIHCELAPNDKFEYDENTLVGSKIDIPMMKKILPYWNNEYLKDPNKNIHQFISEMQEIFKNEPNVYET